MVLGHLGINVPDLGQAKTYYHEVMPLLGYEVYVEAEDELSFMPANGKRGTYLFLYPATATGPYRVTKQDCSTWPSWCPPGQRSEPPTSEQWSWGAASSMTHRTSRSTHLRTSQPSGSTPSASCSKPSAITTPPEAPGPAR